VVQMISEPVQGVGVQTKGPTLWDVWVVLYLPWVSAYPKKPWAVPETFQKGVIEKVPSTSQHLPISTWHLLFRG